MNRGEIWWAAMPDTVASAPVYRHPVIIVQADSFNHSRIRTVLVVAITSNLKLAEAPGNLFLKASQTGLPKDSVANVSQVITLDKDFLIEKMGEIKPSLLHQLNEGLRLVFNL